MYDLDKFKIKVIKDENREARIEVGPFPKGFGHTIGNAIRRIMLTSISGSAITSVKVKGMKHEYTTVDGLQEDVIRLVLNLKNVAIKSFAEEPVTLTLSKKGTKGKVVEVTAGDFSKNSDVEIANPEFVIAELTDEKTKLDIEVVVERGLGYSLPNEAKRNEVSVIPIDAIYSPVKHVKMDIVPTRVGKQTDFDQINLDIYSDGSTKPIDVFLEAVEIFDLVANRMVDLAGGDSENNTLEVEVEEEVEIIEKSLPVSEINLSTRLMNSLLNSGITDLTQLDGKSTKEILSFKGMGKKSYDELMAILQENEVNINL